MCVGAVGAVGSVGGGQIDPILMERYVVLNRKLRLKRIKEEEGVESLDELWLPKVEAVEPALTPDELREIYANPISAQTPIKIAYTILQRICDETLRISQNTEYLKPIALRMYGG